MRTSIQLTSETLGFDRTGQRLVVVEPEALEVLDLERGQTLRLEHRGRFVRYDFDGHVLAYTEATTFTKARHVADAVEMLSSTLPAILPTGVTTDEVLGGAVLEDGDVVLVLGGNGQRTLARFSSAGHQLQRCAYSGPVVRLANRCAMAAVLVEPRTVSFIDLRIGREVGSVRLAHDAHDLAIDPDGSQLAVRYAHERIELIAIEPHAQIHPEFEPTDIAPIPSVTAQWRVTPFAQPARAVAR